MDDPAAVAKELIENAIDAGAHFIAVSVRGGGLAELRVRLCEKSKRWGH